jgi:hypothetical protein
MMSHGGEGAPVTGGADGRVLQCQRGKERVTLTPHLSHNTWRTGSLRRQRLDTEGGSVLRWRGG